MKTTLIDHMGTDLSVVNAARGSFGKVSAKLSEKDAKLISYLAKHNHWTPFGHTAVTLHIKAPLFVARQLGKHQVGLVWNEVSRRYVSDEPEFYQPEEWRVAAANVKQGSSDEVAADNGTWRFEYLAVCNEAVLQYDYMIREGICAEQARMVLPQSMYTEWYWTGSIAAFSRVYKLRIDPHTQRETQEVAKQIGDLMEPLFPISWKALTA